MFSTRNREPPFGDGDRALSQEDLTTPGKDWQRLAVSEGNDVVSQGKDDINSCFSRKR
jgi:hypothetical protein